MKRYALIALAAAGMAAWATIASAAIGRDACFARGAGVTGKLLEKRPALNDPGAFQGEIQIANRSPQPVTIGGYRLRDGLHVEVPDFELEVQDGSGKWHPAEFYPLGTFGAPPDRLVLKPGEDGRVFIDFGTSRPYLLLELQLPKDQPERSYRFRIAMSSLDQGAPSPRVCFTTDEFEMVF